MNRCIQPHRTHGEAEVVVGTGPRHTPRIVAALINTGVLVSVSPAPGGFIDSTLTNQTSPRYLNFAFRSWHAAHKVLKRFDRWRRSRLGMGNLQTGPGRQLYSTREKYLARWIGEVMRPMFAWRCWKP